MRQRPGAVLRVFLFVLAAAGAILHGDGSGGGSAGRPLPVADDPAFGCRWTDGAMGAALECTCREDAQIMNIEENSLYSYALTAIKIRQCPKVTFGRNSVKSMRTLREVELTDITELILEERSFHWDGYTSVMDLNTPALKITVRNTTVKEIASYSFMGAIQRVEFDRARIENIAPFAFSPISQVQSIGFYNTHVANVQPQAFKKFAIENLNMHNSYFENLPSRAFSDMIVTDNFMISNSNFTAVRSGAFMIDNPRRFEVTNSNFSRIDGEAFRVATRGDVVFRTCNFNTTYDGIFLGISLNLREALVRKLFVLDNVTFREITGNTFKINTTGFDLKLNNIFTLEPCDCRRIRPLENEYPLESIYCFQDTPTSYQEFKNSSCSVLTSNATLIIVVCTILILLIFVGTGLWCYFKKVYRCDKYGEGKDNKTGKLSMIVPDGRTYRETELHVIVERTDLLTTDL